MKSLVLRLTLFDPVTDETFHVVDDVVIDILPFFQGNVVGTTPPLVLEPNKPSAGLFFVENKAFRPTKSHYLRVGFLKRMFSKRRKRFLAAEEIREEDRPLYYPSKLPYWDSGWDDDYGDNEFFGNGDVKGDTSEAKPLELRVPIRPFYNIGHRGAPYHFPENTIPSFQKALHLGANGIEFDLCLTQDRRIVIFHDSQPSATSTHRQIAEGLPYPVVSPQFDLRQGTMYAIIRRLQQGAYREWQAIRMETPYDMNLVNLPVERIREYYHYHHMDGVEHPIPELEDLLRFASLNAGQLRFMFFDIKNPGEKKGPKRTFTPERELMREYGRLIGEAMKKFPTLPETMVLCNVVPEYIDLLRKGVTVDAGEKRALFAYDAGGLSFVKHNPLKVANEKKTEVISIGSALRPGDLDEIKQAVRCRDYPDLHGNKLKTKIRSVVHWTVNEPPQIVYSFMAGVNGILTDRPEELKKTLEERLKVALG